MIRIVAILVACLAPTLAQPPPVPGMRCTSSVDVPALVPSEGVAELVSDVVLKCQGGTPTPAGQPIPQVTLQAYINANLTSRLVATSPDLSEALLLLDDPPPRPRLFLRRNTAA